MSERPNGGKPTKAQVSAVRSVLYEPKRLLKLEGHTESIGVLMNVGPNPQAGVGIQWTIPATGNRSPNVTEAIGRCRKIAKIMNQIADEIGGLQIPADDRRQLRKMVNEQGACWKVRADVWEADGRPDVEAEANRISDHLRSSFKAADKVKPYLRKAGSKGGAKS